MTVYTPNIPQPGDNPSDSQDQILENFQTLETLYGTSGDHYSWTNTAPGESSRHAKVTFPGLPTASAPGNTLPTTTLGSAAMFGQTRDNQTTPFLTRDGLAPTAPLTNIWPLMPIKAYASFNVTGSSTGAILDSFNISSAVVSTVAGVVTVTFTITNAMRTVTDYGVLISLNSSITTASKYFYTVTNATTFAISITNVAVFPFRFTATVIES